MLAAKTSMLCLSFSTLSVVVDGPELSWGTILVSFNEYTVIEPCIIVQKKLDY